MTKEAVIIGGSISGLMCGIMLKHHGYTVTILEKEDLLSRQGFDAGISIRDEVITFLKKHDRVKRDITITCPPGTLISVDGKPVSQRGQTMNLTSWPLLISVLRANFDGTTSKAAPEAPMPEDSDGKAAYMSKTRVMGIEEVGGEVQIEYEDLDSKKTDKISASLIIVADGSNSSTRGMLIPNVKRTYAGYMLWRGTTSEKAVDPKLNELYSGKFSFSFHKETYSLNYTIPTDDGDLTPGKRLHNWAWYSNLAADSTEMKNLFTDINGKEHFGTVPRGLVKPEAWEAKKALATSLLDKGHAEIVKRTTSPFITKVFDVSSPQALFMGGKVFLVGDYQITIRPNVGLGSTHAAHDCNTLERFIENEITAEQWEKTVLRYGAVQSRFAFAVSAYGLGNKPALLWYAGCWLLLMLAQKIGLA